MVDSPYTTRHIDAASAKIFAKVAAEISANSVHYTRWHDSQCMFLYAMKTGFANISVQDITYKKMTLDEYRSETRLKVHITMKPARYPAYRHGLLRHEVVSGSSVTLHGKSTPLET
jgi:hypothetical protein